MARREKAPPARRRDRVGVDDDSLLIRSAESLGRVIGALQRELDRATQRLSDGKPARKKRARKSTARKTTKKR